ncbi:MAG TPA: hypothetical protein VNC78_02165 [Actinomycetota bacterium]|nr:hypothetical protein [Actinomycetota bacterium]
MLRIRSMKLIFAVAAIVLLTALPAKACSCAYSDPRDRLEEADGAIIGTFLDRRPATEPTPGGETNSFEDTIYRFSVDEVFKGEFGNEVEVHSASNGASCGLEVQEGQKYGLFLTMAEDAWNSNLCSQTSPEEMRKAAGDLPAPDGKGPTRYLVGGSFGRAQVIALDEKGRTLAYGFGGRDTTHLSVCPGSRKFAELAREQGTGSPYLIVRKLGSLDVVREVRLPIGRDKYASLYEQGLSCRNRRATSVFVFAGDGMLPRASSVILRVKRRDVDEIYSGTARAAEFARSRVYLAEGRRGRQLSWLDPTSGDITPITRVSVDGILDIALSPDGESVAGTSIPAYDSDAPVKGFRVDVRSGDEVTRDVGRSGAAFEVVWDGARRIVLAPGYGTARVLAADLTGRGRITEWFGNSPLVFDGRLWGVADGQLLGADLPDGPAEKVRDLPSPITWVLEAVPEPEV